MILKLYKSNSTLVIFGLPILMLLLWLPAFMSNTLTVINQSTLIFEWFDIESPILNRIFAFIIIFTTAVILNAQINKNEIFERNTYIPALFYVLTMSSISELQQMHPLILSNLFWVLAYRRLLNIYNQVQCKSEVFDASLFFCIGTLISFPSAGVMLLLPFITLTVVRPFDFKEYLMPFFALFLASIYLSAYYYISQDEISYLSIKSVYYNLDLPFNWTYYIVYGLIAIVMYLSGFKLLAKSNTSSVRFRKTTSVLLSFLALTFIAMVYEKLIGHNDSFLLIGAVPFSLLWSFFFFYNEKKWIGSLIFYTILILLIVNIYLPMYTLFF